MNAWSLLYDELYMNDMDWVSANGGFEYTPESSNDSPDTIVLGNEINLNLDATTKNGFWKYEEDLTMKEVRDYLSGTYNPTTHLKSLRLRLLILSKVLVMQKSSCRSNAIKYLSRFGKKTESQNLTF